jgi:hypothetical protein
MEGGVEVCLADSHAAKLCCPLDSFAERHCRELGYDYGSPLLGQYVSQLNLVIINVFAKVLRTWHHHKGTSNSQYRKY